MKKLAFGVIALMLSVFPLNSGHAKKKAAEPASPFATLKTLEGTWKGQPEMGGKKEDMTLIYKVTSGGNAIEETIFAGSPKEMVSVYFQDKDHIEQAWLHYNADGTTSTSVFEWERVK